MFLTGRAAVPGADPPAGRATPTRLEPEADVLECVVGCLWLFSPLWVAGSSGPLLWAVWKHGSLPPLDGGTAVPYLFAAVGAVPSPPSP